MSNHILFRFMVEVSSHQLFVRFAIQFDQVGNQPTRVISRAIKMCQLKIPVLDLKEMELHLVHMTELERSLFDLIQKECKMVWRKAFYGKLTNAVARESFAQVHEL